MRQVVEFSLKKAGYDVLMASDGKEGLEMIAAHAPDLVVLDILMPELDGLEVCKKIRNRSNLPIIFLTSVDEELDCVVGLELGADDYVTKPFSQRELIARIKTVLRRVGETKETDPSERVISHGTIIVDLDKMRVRVGGIKVELTATEFAILRTLVSYPGKVYTRGELMMRAYDDGTVVSDRTIDSHVKRIRKKFEPTAVDPIDTVHGAGYRIADLEKS
jgi:two-component system OmpR family response regulator